MFNQSLVGSVFNILSVTLVVVVLIRCGLLAVVALWAVQDFLTWLAPLTPDLSAWYANIGLAAVTVVVALALFSFNTSLAGRPLLGKGWLGDE